MGEEIRHFQTVMPVSMMEQLKRLTGKSSAKDALFEAAKHYLECPLVKEKKKEGSK